MTQDMDRKQSRIDMTEEPPKNKSLIRELYEFLMVRKMWWLAPIIIMLLLVAIFIIVGQSSALSPFIYAFF